MEQKKELILRVLEKLEWYWDMAPWFLAIVERTSDEKIVEDLLKLIRTGIKTIKNKRIKEKLVSRVKELQRKWDLEQEQNWEEADNLLEDFINNIED